MVIKGVMHALGGGGLSLVSWGRCGKITRIGIEVHEDG